MVKIWPSKRGGLLINNEVVINDDKWIDPLNGDKPFKNGDKPFNGVKPF